MQEIVWYELQPFLWLFLPVYNAIAALQNGNVMFFENHDKQDPGVFFFLAALASVTSHVAVAICRSETLKEGSSYFLVNRRWCSTLLA